MSVKSKDISYPVVDAIYDALGGDNNFLYQRRETITLSGVSGTADITNNGVTRTATFDTDTTKTAENFVTANAAAYLAAGSILSSALNVLTFTDLIPGTGFILSTIVNKTLTLDGVVANADIKYPIYKAIPMSPDEIYLRIGEVIETEDGTKDDFVFRGSVPVIVCDESQTRQADKKKAQTILNVSRGILKPTKASVPSGFIQFGHEGKTEYVDMNDEAKPKVRVVDIYKFIIE